jgi:tubulin polyglutamylase TTLL6/13
MGWKAIEDEKKEDKCNIFWVDVALIHERLRMAQPWQIVNHFPGMPNIARKNRMGQNLNKFQKLFPVCISIIYRCTNLKTEYFFASCIMLLPPPSPEQKEYSFYPRTWVLPGELSDFRAQFDNQGNSLGNKIFIIKPDTGCQVCLPSKRLVSLPLPRLNRSSTHRVAAFS